MSYVKLILWGGVFFCVYFCAGGAGGDELIGSNLLKEAGLQSAWQIQLPLKPSEQIERLDVFEGYLYVLTDRNFFFCIERNTGTVRDLLQIAVAGLPVLPPIHFEKKSVFLVGQELKIFDPAIGRITQTMKLSQLSGSYGGIARNSGFIYICGSDNRLYAFSAEKGKEDVCLFMATAANDSPIHSVLATNTMAMVWFGTTAGNIVAMESTNPRKIWQFDLSGDMVAPLVLDAGFIYAAGLDSKVYKIDSVKGTLAWEMPFLAGDAIRDPLTLGKTCVYVYAANTGLYAVDKQTGKAVWNLPRGYAVLSEKDTRSYIYVRPGVLTLMDNSTGKENLSINIAGVDRFAVNLTDSVLYLADKKGRVMATEPIPENKSGAAKP
jgi:hypothetical protein